MDPHSNDFWAQSNLTLKTSGRLSSLTVELRIARTGGVRSTGAWRSLPEGDFGQSERTVPAGEWVFAGQYDHERGGRDAGDDSYVMTGVAGGRACAVTGDFAPHDGA
ncbi:hypothetical protein GCM10010300_27870 [Streptomyces olivaceoviridis]|uniref:hypothetical protein n=1 Tax=Streptomyces olivaceoviridis TaxID=1921 RepID=UPI0019A6614A|nr:hypothetical protein [Streptomyces olivaceoviridis]GGY82407.1 hypothetical protein GCM10010300_27870 [Streptomyces olivaceoviridis]